jgi:hypothetical protein
MGIGQRSLQNLLFGRGLVHAHLIRRPDEGESRPGQLLLPAASPNPADPGSCFGLNHTDRQPGTWYAIV